MHRVLLGPKQTKSKGFRESSLEQGAPELSLEEKARISHVVKDGKVWHKQA
jgi:hypothetical protein